MPPGAVSPDTRSKIFLPREIIQQPLLGLVAGSQSANPAAAFEDGQPGLFRAGDSRDPHAHLLDKGITAGSDHAVVVADLAVPADSAWPVGWADGTRVRIPISWLCAAAWAVSATLATVRPSVLQLRYG